MVAALHTLWSRDLHVKGHQPVVRESLLVVPERKTRLVRLDAVTGDMMWELRVGDPWGTLSVGLDRLAYREQSGVLQCVGLDGEVLWVQRPSERYVDFVSICETAVVTGGRRGYQPLRGWSLNDGAPLWVAPGRRGGRGLTHLRPVPFAGGLLGAVLGQPDVWLLDPVSGIVRQRWPLPEPIAGSEDGPTPFRLLGDGSVVFRCGPASVYRLVAGGTPTFIWSSPAPLDRLPPVLGGRRLWLARANGLSVADTVTGEQRDMLTTQQPLADIAVVGEQVAVVDRSGLLYLFDLDGRVMARRQMPRFAVSLGSATPGVLQLVARGQLIALSTT